nr:hypothetical protein [Burkholderiaceae bacterium]
MNRRTDDTRSDRDGLEPDGLSPLVRQWPDEAPPAWLDANIRAAAHDAARIAAQKAAPAEQGGKERDGKGRRPATPGHWNGWNRWLPLGGTLATAVLAVLLVIARPGDDRAHDRRVPSARRVGTHDRARRQRAGRHRHQPAGAAQPLHVARR